MAKIYTLATALLTFALASNAAIPVRWTTDAYKVKPLVYECYHGETLDLAASLTAYGEPIDFSGKTAKLYWQTNGMDQAWWSTNATVRAEYGSTNVLAAIWSGAYDTGAASVTGFIGVEGENYRASFTLNFRPSPGFVPNQMPIPPKTIDWATVANSNVDAAPFALKGSGLTPEQAKVIAANQVTNDVAPWAMAGKSEPQGMTTNAVENIADNRITNSVQSGYLCTVSAAQGMTNGVMTAANGKFLQKQYSAFEGGISGTVGWSNTDGYNYLSVSPMQDEIVRFTAAGVYLKSSNWNLLYRNGGEGEANLVTLKEEFDSRDTTIGSMQSSIAVLQTGKANVDDVYTKTQINGNTVTNGGAVAAAKAYADGKFLQTHNGSSWINWGDAGELNIFANAIVGGTMAFYGSDWSNLKRQNISLQSDLDAKANVSDVYTKTQIDGTTVTNLGAVVASKTYTDSANATTRAIVATWENFLDGSNVVFSITNYISGTYNIDAAKLRIMEMTNGVYREVYNSRDEILLHINNFKNTDFATATNQVIQGVSAAIADKADKEWGKYTSAGGEAPSNTVYMTAPNTVFAGGMEYERVAVGEGSVCILTTKGAPVYTQGDEGTFKFQDDGGTNYFGFAKTDSYVIGANASGISAQNNIVTINYDVTMSGVPCIWYKADISSNVAWEQLNLPDGTPVAGASHVVSWEATPPAGRETCYINCPEAKGFFKATIEVAGSAKFMTNMPADFSGGILCTDGEHKVKINWNNGAPTLVPAN